MGYLTTFTIYNDGANGITKDPIQFADKIDSLIGTTQYEEFHTTTGVNGFVQQSIHADDKTIYVNAGNCVTEVSPYSKSFKELIKKHPDFARELVEFVEAEVVELKKTLIKELPIGKLNNTERYKIAENPKTSPETLARLADDEEWIVRRSVAQNPNTPPEALERLANEDDPRVRERVAFNHNTQPQTLERLANDADYWVRRLVVNNPNTPKETINLLLSDNREEVREAASYRINNKT
jgi:hypothetical protein